MNTLQYMTGRFNPRQSTVRHHTRIRGIYVHEERDCDGFRIHAPQAYVMDDYGNLKFITSSTVAHSLRDGANAEHYTTV